MNANKVPTRIKDGGFAKEKSHKQHIIIVVLNDRYFKREGKTSLRDMVSHQINKAGLKYIFFTC